MGFFWRAFCARFYCIYWDFLKKTLHTHYLCVILVGLWKFYGIFMPADISANTNQSRISVLFSGAALQLEIDLAGVLTPPWIYE